MNDTKKIIAAIVVLLIVLIAVGFGIFNNIQDLKKRNLTATFAARQAIEAHDLETFKQYVDTDAIINQAAEQILTAQINATLNPTAYSMDELQTLYENQLKPDFVKSARAALDEYITTGKVIFPTELTAAQKFLKKSGADSCEIRSVSKPILEGSTQTSTVIFYNRYMKFSFELELELEPNGDSWKIVGAKGFEDYYNGYRRSLRRKLDSLNAPIGQEMDEIFRVKSFSVKNSGGDEYGFSKTLDIVLKADVHLKKPVSKVIGNVIITGKDDRESISPFAVDMSGKNDGLQNFDITKTLNPFVRADSYVMKHGLSKRDIHIEVTEIIFADGTSLKQLTELPE